MVGLAEAATPFQSARIQGISLQADSLFRDSENEIVELEGHVQIIFQNQHLKCARARINLRAKSVDARGDVLVTSPQANIGGDRVILDYETGTGVIYNGYVQSGTVLFEGSIINKTSDIDYLADDAKYTACTTCPEAWSFTGTKIRAELGGYAYIKNSVMRFGGFPFFWMPYLVVPLKSDRQTGLLTPSFESEDPGGLILSQPFFWAIDRSHDATITMKNYELRGLKSLLEYNYVLSENSRGVLNTAFLRDKVFATEERLNTFRPPSQKNDVMDRWVLNYEHYFELPDGYVQRMQLNNVSDLQYHKDFSSETKGNLDPALENRISVTKNTRSQHYSVDAAYNINLLEADPLAGNDDSVHRLPEIRFSQAVTKLGMSDFLFSFDLDYVNFARAGNSYDDLNAAYDPNVTNNRFKKNTCNTPYHTNDPNCHDVNDGTYDPNQDLIRAGQRLDVAPTIYRPFTLGGLVDILPRLTYRETQYNFGLSENSIISRRYVRAEVSGRGTASRVYGNLSAVQGWRLKHEIQPEFTATSIPWYDQPNHPFFGSKQDGDIPGSSSPFVGDGDLNSPFGLQFDYNDRVFDRKLLTFGITNKLTQKTWVNETPQYLQFFSWKLAQSYDLFQAEQNDPKKQALSAVTSELRFTLPQVQLAQQLNYFPYQNVSNSDTTLRLTRESGDAASLRYLNQYTITPGQDVDQSTRSQEYKVILRKFSRSMDFLGTVVMDPNPLDPAKKYKLWAYGVEIKIPGDCSSVQIFDKIEYGKREQKVQIGFVWDGQAKSTFINKISALAPFGI
jgi:LPS-assembly protein